MFFNEIRPSFNLLANAEDVNESPQFQKTVQTWNLVVIQRVCAYFEGHSYWASWRGNHFLSVAHILTPVLRVPKLIICVLFLQSCWQWTQTRGLRCAAFVTTPGCRTTASCPPTHSWPQTFLAPPLPPSTLVSRLLLMYVMTSSACLFKCRSRIPNLWTSCCDSLVYGTSAVQNTNLLTGCKEAPLKPKQTVYLIIPIK